MAANKPMLWCLTVDLLSGRKDARPSSVCELSRLGNHAHCF